MYHYKEQQCSKKKIFVTQIIYTEIYITFNFASENLLITNSSQGIQKGRILRL